MEANWTTGGRWMTNWFEPDEEGYGIEDGGKASMPFVEKL